MRVLPDLYHVGPHPRDGECGLVEVVRSVAARLGSYGWQPVSVVCLSHAGTTMDDPQRWTIAHLTLRDGSYVTATMRPDPTATPVDRWAVTVNGHDAYLDRPPGSPLHDDLAYAAARALRNLDRPPQPWVTP